MMIKQIFKMIWNQRRLNGWIWMELLVVFVALWYLVDMFVVQLYSYTRPMGYHELLEAFVRCVSRGCRRVCQ